jgi:hypothetical protein
MIMTQSPILILCRRHTNAGLNIFIDFITAIQDTTNFATPELAVPILFMSFDRDVRTRSTANFKSDIMTLHT